MVLVQKIEPEIFQVGSEAEELDFAAMKEGKPDALFDAWLALPDGPRDEMDAELRDIFALCCEKGFLAILDEARWQLREDSEAITQLVEKLSALPNHFERAMVTFLEHKDFWKGATRVYHADTLSYWRKRKNLPHRAAAVDEASIQQLARQISNYLHHTEGRGKNCVVEPYRRGERDYFLCYPEDHSQHSIRSIRPGHPATWADRARGFSTPPWLAADRWRSSTGGSIFACRHCFQSAYPSRRETTVIGQRAVRTAIGTNWGGSWASLTATA